MSNPEGATSNASARPKWRAKSGPLRAAAVLTALGAAAIASYYLLHIRGRERILDDFHFRVLATAVENIATHLEGRQEQVGRAIRDEVQHPTKIKESTLAEHRERKTDDDDENWVLALEDDHLQAAMNARLLKVDDAFQRPLGTGTKAGLETTTEKPDQAPFKPFNPFEIDGQDWGTVVELRTQGARPTLVYSARWGTFERWRSESGVRTELSKGEPLPSQAETEVAIGQIPLLAAVVDDLPTDIFDSVIVARADGRVLVQARKRGEEGVRLSQLPVRVDTGGSDDQGAGGMDGGRAFYEGGTSAGTVEIAGRDYRIFTQPLRLPIVLAQDSTAADGSAKDSQRPPSNEWVLAGLRRVSEVRAQSLAISSSSVVGVVFLFVLAFLGLPLFRLFSIGPREEITRNDVAVITVSTGLGAAIVGLMLADGLGYLSLKEQQQLEVEAVAADFDARVVAEAAQLAATADALTRQFYPLLHQWYVPLPPNLGGVAETGEGAFRSAEETALGEASDGSRGADELLTTVGALRHLYRSAMELAEEEAMRELLSDSAKVLAAKARRQWANGRFQRGALRGFIDPDLSREFIHRTMEQLSAVRLLEEREFDLLIGGARDAPETFPESFVEAVEQLKALDRVVELLEDRKVDLLRHSELVAGDALTSPFVETVWWMDEDAAQTAKWTVRDKATALTKLPDREYAKRALNDDLWSITDANGKRQSYFIQSIRSKTTGRVYAVLSKAIVGKREGDDEPADEAPFVPPTDASPIRIVPDGAAGASASTGNADTFFFPSITAEKLERLERLGKQEKAKPARVTAIESVMRTLFEPILPPEFGFAVVDPDGLVLFHSDASRNLAENLFEELGQDDQLRAAVAAGVPGHFDRTYRTDEIGLYVRPMTFPDWSLVLFTPKDTARAFHLETLLLTFSQVGLLLLLLVAAGAWALVSRRDELERGAVHSSWYWPDRRLVVTYLLLSVGLVALLAGWSVFLVLQQSTNALVYFGFAMPLLLVGIVYVVLSPWQLRGRRGVRHDLVTLGLVVVLALLGTTGLAEGLGGPEGLPAVASTALVLVLLVSWRRRLVIVGAAGWFVAQVLLTTPTLPSLVCALGVVAFIACAALARASRSWVFTAAEARRWMALDGPSWQTWSTRRWHTCFAAMLFLLVAGTVVLPTWSFYRSSFREVAFVDAKRRASTVHGALVARDAALEDEFNGLAMGGAVRERLQEVLAWSGDAYDVVLDVLEADRDDPDAAASDSNAPDVSETDSVAPDVVEPDCDDVDQREFGRYGLALRQPGDRGDDGDSKCEQGRVQDSPLWFQIVQGNAPAHGRWSTEVRALGRESGRTDLGWDIDHDSRVATLVDRRPRRSAVLGLSGEREATGGGEDGEGSTEIAAGTLDRRVVSAHPWTMQDGPVLSVAVAALLIAAVGLILLRSLASRVFVLDRLRVDPVSEVVPTGERCRRRILLRPRRDALRRLRESATTKTFGPERFRDGAPVADLLAEVESSGPQVVLLTRFEEAMEDVEARARKLEFLERLLDGESARLGSLEVALASNIDPHYLIAAQRREGDGGWTDEEYARWAELLESFAKIRNRGSVLERRFGHSRYLAELRALVQAKGSKVPAEVVESVADECWVTWELQEIGASLVAGEQSRQLTPGAVVELVNDQAESHYARLWSECSREERLTMFRLAHGSWPNWRALDVLVRLRRRALLLATPNLHLMNESFRRFVLTVESPAAYELWASEGELSVWQRLRVPMVVGLLVVVAFFFITQRQAFNQTLGAIAAMAAGVPAAIRLISLVPQGRRATEHR